MEIDERFLEILLGATEIYGTFRGLGDEITVGHRGHLLDQLEGEFIPHLMPHKDKPYVRKILERYNLEITKNIYSNKPIELD